MRSSGAQVQAGDLRRATDSHGQQDLANAAADINLSAVQAIPSGDEALAQFGPGVERSHNREPDLAAVGMAGQHQVDVMLGSHPNSHRVVAEQDLGVTRRDMAHSSLQVVRIPPQVVYTSQPQPAVPGMYSIVRIAKHVDVMGFKRPRHLIGVHLEIVISQDRKNSQARPQTSQHLRYGPDISGRKSDVVSGKGDQVGLQVVGHFYGAFDVFERRVEAVVDIRQVDDSQTVMSWAEPPQVDVNLSDFRIWRNRRRRKLRS